MWNTSKEWRAHAAIQPDDVYILLFRDHQSHPSINELLQSAHLMCRYLWKPVQKPL